MTIESMIILDEKVENKDRRFGSNLEYYPCLVKDKEEIKEALFTEHVIQEAIERAKRNPEDIPRDQTFWEKIFG